MTDAIWTLSGLFLGGPQPACADAADADDDGSVGITDAIFTLDYLFRGGFPPGSPGVCDPDRTSDGLSCQAPSPCAVECPEGWLLCGFRCVETQYDSNNCGRCGVKCPPDKFCVQGECVSR